MYVACAHFSSMSLEKLILQISHIDTHYLFLKRSQPLLLINSLATKIKQADNNNKDDNINIILCNWIEG